MQQRQHHWELGTERGMPPHLFRQIDKSQPALLATELARPKKWSKPLLLSDSQLPCGSVNWKIRPSSRDFLHYSGHFFVNMSHCDAWEIGGDGRLKEGRRREGRSGHIDIKKKKEGLFRWYYEEEGSEELRV